MRRSSVLLLTILLVVVTGCGSSTTSGQTTPAVGPPGAADTSSSASPDAAAVSPPEPVVPATQAAVVPATQAAVVPATQEIAVVATTAAASVAASATATDAGTAEQNDNPEVYWARTLLTTTLYLEPDTNAPVIDTVDAGRLVVVTETRGEWYRIIHIGDSAYAWVPATALTLDVAQANPTAGEQTTSAAQGSDPAGAATPAAITAPVSSASVTAAPSAPIQSGLSGTLVFQQSNGGTIYVYDLENRSLRTLTGGFDPVLSPDGQSIVYLSNQDASGSTGDWHLWVMDADGGNQRLLDPEVLGHMNFRYDSAVDQVVDWQ